MKMKYLLIFTIVLTGLLISCSVLDTSATPNNSNNISPENNDMKKNIYTEPRRVTEYKNEKLGFELTFPEGWSEWYVVNEIDENAIEVAFFGKSKTATMRYKEFNQQGLHLFYIVAQTYYNENVNFLDSAKKIGMADGVAYYYATRTDWVLGELAPSSDRSNLSEEEIKLIKMDYEKAMQMQDEVDEVIKTFKAIK